LSRVCNKHNTNSSVLLNVLAGNKEYCVNEKHSKNRERWSARLYSSSGAGSGVVLRHRAAAAACACLAVDAAVAAAYCTPQGRAQIRPAGSFMHNHSPNSRGFTKVFF